MSSGADEALDLARRIVESGIPYAAFGGGEPLGVAHCWELFELLTEGGVALKLETDGSRIDDAGRRPPGSARRPMRADFGRRRDRGDPCPRPSGIELRGRHLRHHAAGRARATAAARVRPNRFNVHEIVAAYELAIALGCSAFVTGPMMRIGRAAAAWDQIACSDEDWQRAVSALRDRAGKADARIALSIYPWDIVTEMDRRLESPQAMLLVVPNGKVKLLNALPFAPADLRRDSIPQALARLQERLAHERGARIHR
jgi:MoaA/NifB/PqqE/SkfB family radical SAM enzyme